MDGEEPNEEKNEDNKEIKLEEWLKDKKIDPEKVLVSDERKGSRLVPAGAAEELKRLFKFYTDQRTDQLFIYHEDVGTWKPDGEIIISKVLEAQFGYITSTKSISEIVGHIKRSSYIDPSKLSTKSTLINLKNGVLDLEILRLLPHSPDYYFTNYLDLEWKQNPEVPKKIIEFLADRAGGDDEKFISLLESAAFPSLPDYRIHTAIMLVGPTHRGKTTYLKLIERIYGGENAAHLSIQQLSLSAKDRPFMLPSLIGKILNISDDLTDKPIEFTGLFKQLTGESPIQAEFKFGGMVSFYNRAKMFFSANKIPVAYETSDAFYGRWLIIEFTRPIQNEKPQEEFMQEIANKEELNNFLPLLAWIARKLMKNTKFTFSNTPEQNEAIYAKHSNTAKLYCETRLRVNPQGSILKANIFNDYKQWCAKHDYLEEKEKTFWSTLKSFFADQESVAERQRTVEGVVKRFYLGLEFVDEEEDEDEEKNTENTPDKDKDLLKEYFGIGDEQCSQGSQDSQDFGIFNYCKYLTDIYNYYKEIKEKLVNPVNAVNSTPNSNTILDSQPADQTSNAATPQTPTSASPHSDTQAQANQQATSPRPAEPALDNNATQPQQDAPAEPQEQAPTLSKEEIAQRVFIAVKLVENEAFWSDSEQQVPNNKIFPTLLQGLSPEEIKAALKSLQWQGYIYEVKPNVWKAVRDLHLVDLVAYDDPNMPTICPQCGRHVTKLYWYGADWYCEDCLAERKRQRGE